MKTLKQIILFVILSLSTNSFAQYETISEYNQKTPIYIDIFLNKWTVIKGTELVCYEQTEKGYKLSYDEIQAVLKFYKFDFNKPTTDTSYFIAEVYDNTELMSSTIEKKASSIYKIWETEKIMVVWKCSELGNFVAIRVLTKH